MPNDLIQILNYVLFASCYSFLIWFVMVEGKNIKLDLKGEDGRWQAIEISAVIWFILFSHTVLGSVFLGLLVATEAWASLDVIFITIVGGKVYKHRTDAKHPKKEEDTKNESLGSEGD